MESFTLSTARATPALPVADFFPKVGPASMMLFGNKQPIFHDDDHESNDKKSFDVAQIFNAFDKLKSHAFLQPVTAKSLPADVVSGRSTTADPTLNGGLNGSLIEVDIKKILDDFRQNLDSSGEIGKAAYYTLFIIYTVAVIVGLCGNILIVCAVLGRKRMRTARNVFIVTLAISDLILCIFTMPSTLWEVLYRKWPFGGETQWLCRLGNSFQATPMFMSSFAIMAIAVDRYRCIIQPDKKQLTTKASCLISSVMFVLAIGMSIPLFVGTQLTDYVDFRPNALKDILLCRDTRSGDMRLVYDICRLIVQFVMPLLVVFGVYLTIFWRLKNRPISQHSSNNKRRRRTNIMIISVSITFFLSWLPYNTLNFVLDLKAEQIQMNGEIQGVDPLVYGLCTIMGLGNACINPILYGYLNENFRREYTSLFKRIPWHSSLGATSQAANHAEIQNNNNQQDPNEGGSRSPSNRSLISNPQQEIPMQVMSSSTEVQKIIPPSKPTLTVSHSSAEAVPLIKNSSTTDINKNRSKSLRRHFRRNSSLKRRPTIQQLGAAADQSFNTTTSSCSVEIEPLEKDVTSPNGTRVKVTFV